MTRPVGMPETLKGQPAEGPRVIVVGGSLGGLTAALVLRDVGCDVEVYERSPVPLEGRGAGIVLHPATVRYLTDHGIVDIREVGTAASRLRYFDQHGEVVDEQPCRYRFTSYFFLHQLLLGCFDRERYHLASEVVSFEQDDHGVSVTLADGRHDRCDLLVGADGIHSTARRRLLPEVAASYAGYVAWRGTISESQLTPGAFALLHEAIAYQVMPRSHILAYPIPNMDGSLEVGHRLVNWVWYRNVEAGERLDALLTDRQGVRHELSLAPGSVRDRSVDDLRGEAQRQLPPVLAETVTKTTQPFVQVVFDIEVPRMGFGRVCLIGDAAFALRPHAAAGTAKAAEDAWKLAEAVAACEGDVVGAVRRWEPAQLTLGRRVLERTRAAGNRSQFEGTWRAGDPLPFGLYEVSDSALPLG